MFRGPLAGSEHDRYLRNMTDFSPGAALVVGGSGGIGGAICKGLAAAGADVALTYRSNAAAATATARAVESSGTKASVHAVDITDTESVARLVAQVSAEHGAIHSVINAAGSRIDQPYISRVEADVWRETFDADVHGFFNVVHATLPALRASKGSIVAISSAGLRRYPSGDILSVAPKAAIEALVRGIAKEEGRFGVRANNVAVGVVDAGMFPKLVESGELSQEWVDAATKNTPLARFASSSEVADAVVFLASSRASYITGQTLSLDGGYSL